MQWLSDLPFADNRVLQTGFLAACGIAALVVLAIVYRLAFAHRLRVPGARTRQPRLGLVDAFSLDGQRQLVLIRRDNVEHLVMIGGPNDVLIEPQINRAMTPARENSQPSPLLAPGPPARRTESAVLAQPVVAEAPPTKAAAPPPAALTPAAAPPAAASTPVAAPASATPRAPAGPAIAAVPVVKPIEANRGRPASAPPPPPPAAQSAEPARPTPASPPPPRPAPPRPAMPPAIVPASGSASRAPVARPPEKDPPKAPPAPGPANPTAPAPAAPAPPPRPERADSTVTAAKAEPRATPPASPVPPAIAPPPKPPPVARTQPSAPAANGSQPPGDGRPPEQKASAPLIVKAPTKADDPFADLESLEAEMARLLGREKPS
jgi:flagellar protein FliO/FliZ